MLVAGLPPGGESALYRSRFPRSWWWRPEFDFHSAVLVTLQVANRQRARKGPKPQAIKRPREVTTPKSAVELQERQSVQEDWLAKRRAQKRKAVNRGY